MKKILFVILAVLFTCGIANATGIPVTVDPKNYPTVWTEQVYNNSSSAVTSGFIVQWDFATSDSSVNAYDDMCPWVKINATDEGIWQAGVVPYGNNIAATSTGSIIIKGPAYVHVGTTAVVADSLAASDTTGHASAFDGGADNEASIGTVISITGLTYGPDGGAEGVNAWCLIYVNPMVQDDN